MRKFVAALVAVVLAAFVTLFGIVAPAQAIGSATCDSVTGVSNAGYIGAPSLSSTAFYLYPTQGSSYTAGPTFSTTGFTGSVAYTTSPALPSGMTINSSTGAITGTPAQSSSAVVYKIQATGTPSVTPPGLETSYCAASEISIEVWASGGGNSSQWTNVSLTYASATHTPAADVTSLANGDSFPGYTVSFAGVGGGTYDSINFLVGDPQNNHFYTVPGAGSNNFNTGSSSWNPLGTNCGVTNIIRGGTPLTASSGVRCMKMTGVFNNQTQYWVRLELGSASAADISFTVAPGTFVVADETSTDQFATFLLRNDNSTSTNYSGRKYQLLNAASVGGVGSSGSSNSIADFALPSGIGQPVAGQTVGINASNLALNTNYSVILRSTPQILEQGTTTATFMNTTVTIPAGLEPGWHSITFSAVRSDGVATEQVAYFKISASGMLLQTSSEVPAELAMTAAPKGDQWTLGVLLAMLGIGLVAAVYTYRRRVFEMVYVLTANGSNFDIELVEQPKNARYLPMRSLKK